MQLGRHLRELWGLRFGLIASVLVAAVAALWSVDRISVLPPAVKPRATELAAASTRALVDTSKSAVLNLGVNTYDFQSITNRSLLIANVMASGPVRRYIARRAGVPADVIKVASPVTEGFPRQLTSASKPKASDILKSPDEYRLSIQSNPTVPIVDVYAQAPTAKAASALANGAIDGMRDYLRVLGTTQQIPARKQVRLQQLGRADGAVLNRGVRLEVACLTFLLVFLFSCASVMFLARVSRGWRMEAAAGREPSMPVKNA